MQTVSLNTTVLPLRTLPLLSSASPASALHAHARSGFSRAPLGRWTRVRGKRASAGKGW